MKENLFYSASYTKVNPNFVLQNINTSKKNDSAVLNILENILLRGCPTIPSENLRGNFGNVVISEKFKYINNYKNLQWDNVILGGMESNPALDFYENILCDILGAESALTFIPELDFNKIVEVEEDNNRSYGRVDFYSPLYNAVIEVDGMQHINSK